MNRREKHQANLRKQLERTRATYLMMREVGYEKSRAVPLKFAFYPATEDSAPKLVEYLREKAGYQVEAGPTPAQDPRAAADDSQPIDGAWMVRGSTPRTRLTAASLGRWVHWMCRAGYRFDCLFDGWGTRV